LIGWAPRNGTGEARLRHSHPPARDVGKHALRRAPRDKAQLADLSIDQLAAGQPTDLSNCTAVMLCLLVNGADIGTMLTTMADLHGFTASHRS